MRLQIASGLNITVINCDNENETSTTQIFSNKDVLKGAYYNHEVHGHQTSQYTLLSPWQQSAPNHPHHLPDRKVVELVSDVRQVKNQMAT